MSPVTDLDTPRQFIAGLESKFSQLTVSLDDLSAQAEPLPVYTPVAAEMPKAQNPEQRGRSPGPRSLASRGLLRHRTARNGKPKSAHPAALAAQLKRRLHSQAQRKEGDEMEIDSGRGRNVRKNSVRAGVLVARKKRESIGLGLDEDADVSGAEMPGPSRTGATPYARNNSALIYWSRRRASSFGERPTWTVLTETNTPTASTSDEPSSTPDPNTLPTTRRRRSGRSASTSGLPLPLLDTTDLTVRRPSLALSLMMTPLIPDVDMASPMAPTPVMRTTTESSMWAPRKLTVLVTSPIEEDLKSAVDMKSALPASPPPAYDSVIRADDSDGDADDERTPLRTAPTPSLAKREGSPVPSSGASSASTSTPGPNASAATPLATVQEEEEPSPATPKAEAKAKPEAEEEPALDVDQDAMIL